LIANGAIKMQNLESGAQLLAEKASRQQLAETASPKKNSESSKVGETAKTRNIDFYSKKRTVIQPALELPEKLELNKRLRMDGLVFLKQLPRSTFPAAFFDPQYRGVLDHLAYGNETNSRASNRMKFIQMTKQIPEFIREIDRVLMPSGHLFLWMDKFHLVSGFQDWLEDTDLKSVDMLTWEKYRIGMGYRTRRKSEFLIVAQKTPTRAKGVWTVHNIPDVWFERVVGASGVHAKPEKLQKALVEAVTAEGETVIDPAAGTFSVMNACLSCNRNFLGCDING